MRKMPVLRQIVSRNDGTFAQRSISNQRAAFQPVYVGPTRVFLGIPPLERQISSNW